MILETTDADTIISQKRKLKARLVLNLSKSTQLAGARARTGVQVFGSSSRLFAAAKGCLINISIYTPDHSSWWDAKLMKMKKIKQSHFMSLTFSLSSQVCHFFHWRKEIWWSRKMHMCTTVNNLKALEAEVVCWVATNVEKRRS